jgi:DNA-binding XRE family transcriptional regulator
MRCKHYGRVLQDGDRHFVESEKHDNCVLCLVNEEGSMTQEQVGQYLQISKMRVSQIERQALKKIKRKYFRLFGKNFFTN